MSLKSVAAAAGGCLIVLAVPAAAQNTTEAPVVAPPPPAKTTSPVDTTAPPATSPAPAETVVEQPAPVVVVPQSQPAPSVTPMTIDPDVAYPNGFADPADPFANTSLSYQERDGFDWGLLGLLGLFGLIPLFRGNGGRYVRTVYVDRDDPKRVIREERHEDRGP